MSLSLTVMLRARLYDVGMQKYIMFADYGLQCELARHDERRGEEVAAD